MRGSDESRVAMDSAARTRYRVTDQLFLWLLTDDHEKNHVVLVDDAQAYELSPAFDVLPSGQALGYQQMRVGTDQADSTLVNAMSMCSSFGLKTDEAAREVRIVVGAIGRWKQHYRSCGVSARDIEPLAEQIDRPFLASQRTDF